jgi:hypothetical protein
MTNLTIELPPLLYERLRQEAERQGKPAQTVAQELLSERLSLDGDASAAPPLAMQMADEIRALIAGKPTTDFEHPPQGAAADAIALVRLWAEEEQDDEGDESWEDVLRSIDAHRTSNRKLFHDLEAHS